MLFGCLSASRSVFGPVEELLAQRGIAVTYETVRQWCGARLGRRTQTNSAGAALGVGTSGIWMRVYLKINGKTHYLWRAVDQDGSVLDMRVAEPTERTRGETLFSQALRKTAIRPTRDHHR